MLEIKYEKCKKVFFDKVHQKKIEIDLVNI